MTDALGYVTIIKRTGADGYRYPLNRPSCLFGRSTECDIRLQLPVVSKQQCRIEFNRQLKEAILVNLNSSNPTHLNGTTISHPVKLEHGDLITIFDRSFRFEYERGIQNEGKPPIRPSGPKNKEVMPVRSRSISTLDYEPCQRRERHHHSFSDIPTAHTEENNTRPFSLMSYLEEMNADKPKKCDDTSDNVEEHLAGKTPTLHKKEPKKITTNVTEKSSISIDPAADCSEDVNVSPTFPKKNENHDFSPFKKLFGLMKGELNSNRHQVGHQSYPSSRKSGPKIHMDDREQKTEPLCSSPSRASPRSQGHLNILNAFGELQEGRSAKEGKPKVLPRSLARGSPGPALELERSHEEERWFEDPYESALEQSQAERFPAEKPSQEVERLKAPRKRRSEGLAAGNSGRRKEEDRRRSAPLLLPSENSSHPSSLYTLRSQTKRFSSWESSKLPKLGGETAQAPDHMGTPVLKESDFNGGGASPDLPKNKGSLLKNNQITPKKKASSSEEMAKETEKEELYFEGNVNESDRSAKRRRVSFGVHLRPELFDENLPPNTPLKRGESPGIRRRGGSQSQTVLRKSIIKQEYSKLLEKEPSSHTVEEGVVHAHVQDLSPELPETKKIFARSSISQSFENAESVAGEIQLEKMNKPSSSKSPAAGRRSQHDILQRIYAKRRSGASEANLMVVRSWADVVRLGTRKPQTDVVVKHGLERRIIKKSQKRLTPKKPANSIKDSFGTGHANSPCTIMIGRAHTEKVTVPIRPCRMLNNFVLKTDMDMNEDFTGLADMFKIHINKKRKSETGTAPPLLFEEMSCKEHPHTSSGDEHTSDECAKKLISTTQDAAQELLASSIFSCRRSPRNRQSRGGDNITKIPEMGNDEIIIPGVEDHKILTSSSKRLKTCTPKENEASPYRNRIKTPENQKIICIEEKLENGSANRATKKFKLSMEQSIDLNFYNPGTPNSTLNTLEDIHVIKRLTEMPNKGDSKENSIEKHTNLKNQNKEILDQLGVTPPLKIRSTKEQPVTNQPVGIPKHRRMSLQNQKYSPTEVNKMTSLKPVIVCPDVIPTSKTVTIKHELGDMKKKVTRTPKQKIELVEYESLSGMTTPRPTAKDKVADFTGDDGKVQKKRRSSIPKQKMELVEDEDLSGIRELMATPRPTVKDKVTDFAGDDGKVQKKRRSSTHKQKIEVVEDWDLMATPRPIAKDKITDSSGDDGEVQRKHKSSTPKQKIELVEYEDLSGIRELVTTPRPTAKDKVANFTGNDGKVQKKRRSSTQKQKIEVVEDEHLSGIRELMVTPRPIAKDKMTDSSGDDGKVQRKRRCSIPKQKIEVVEDEDLSGIRELVTTPGSTAKDKVADSSGDDGKVQRKRRSSIPKQKIEVMEDEDLSGIWELMATPRPTAKDKVADFAGDDGKVQRKRSSIPKQKIEVVEDEDLSGIRELVTTPRSTTKDKLADSSGDTGKVQRKHRSLTPKQKIEVVEDEDLSGIRELVTAPRSTAKDKVADSSGDDGKVQRKRRSSTPKQKIEVVEDEDMSGIRELMATPKPTAKDKVADFAGDDGKVQKNRRGSTQKQKIELVEYEDLSGIRELMTTPRPTAKDKMTDSSGDDGKVQKNLRSSTPKQKIELIEDENLSGILELMTTPRSTTKDKVVDFAGGDGKVQKNRRGSTQKQKIEVVEYEDLSGIRELMTTPRPTAKDKMTDSSGDDGKVQKNLRSSTPKQKIELIEDENLSGILELMTTPRSTTKDKVVDFAGGDGKVQKNRRGSTQKQKIEVVEYEDLSGIRELMTTPRPTAKDKMTDSSGDDGKVQKNLRSSTPKQKIELVEDENLSGIWELMITPGPTAKDKVADFAGDDGKVQKKRRSSTPKQKVEVAEEEVLSGIRELMATPRSTTKGQMADFAGDDGKVQKKRRSSPPKQKVEVAEEEVLSGIRELMATPGPTAKDKVADFAGDDGKVQKKRRSSPPKQKVEVAEEEVLSGIWELMATPGPTAKDKVADFAGDDGKVQKKHRSSTPKQKVEVAEDEDLSGIRELMATPRSTTKEKVADFAGDDGKVQKNRRGSTQKQKIELVVYEDLSGIRELMTTPRPTAKVKMADSSGDDGKVQKNLRSSTPKQKIEVVEDEDLSGIRELMATPRSTTKDKLAGFVGDDGKVQKNLTTSKQIVCTATDAKVQKKLMRSVKQQIEMEDLNDTEQLKKTPKRKCEPVEDLTMVKRLMRSPKDKVEPGEVVVCSKRLLRTPKEKAPTVVESVRKLVPALEENLESLSTPKQRVVDLVKEKVNKDVILTKCESENLSRTRRQSRIAKEKEELIEDIKCVKNSIKTAKQKCDPVEDDMALGTKNLSKTQPIDDNSGLGKLINKPQEGKNVENIAYPKKLMKTPKEKIALLKIPTHKVKPEDLNVTFNERGELTEDPVNTKKLVRTPKEKEGELMKDLNAIRLRTPKEKGQLDKDLTGVTVFMGTPNKVEDISNSQEISESDSELLQELKMLRKKAIDDFSASNQEPQIIEEILEPAQEVKPQTVGGGRVRNKLPKSRKRVVGDVFQLKTPSRTKDSNFEVDYTGFKEMFESPKESKDYSGEVDQFQLQICTNPFEKDEDKSDPSKIDGSLYSMSLKENVQKDETSQAQQEHDTLPSEIENPVIKTQKKALLRLQGEIKDTGGSNQRTLRTRRKTTFDAKSKVASRKIDDEKIVKNVTTGRNKKSLDSFLDEVSDKNDSSERTLRSRRNTRFNAESRLASAKMDDGSLEHSEKEEPVKTGSRTFCNAESRRHLTHKEVQSCSSGFSEGEKENSEEPVDNLKKRVAGRATSRSRSKNKNAESPNESNVSHTNDEKCSDNKRLTEGKLIQKMAAPPLRFSSRNKTSKELLGSPSSLLSETNRSPREKNEKKKRVTITTRIRSKADIKLQESTGSLVNKIVSSPKEGDEEEKFEKRLGNKGNSVLRSRNRNKSKDMLLCESNISYTDEERENIKNLPEKQKEHKVRVTVSRNSKFLNTCNSLCSSENNENPMNSCDQGRTDVNEKGIGLRTRSRNKSKEKQESYSIHTECREDNEGSLPARSKSISVNEKMASSRTRNRIKNATETQEVNTLPTEVYKPQTEEKSNVASLGKVDKSRSKKKMDLKKSEPVTSSPEKLELQSKNQDVTETQEVSHSCCVQTAPDQHNASLRSRTRKRLLHSSSVEPEELCLKDEKPVKTQKSLNDTTEDGKPSLKPKRKRKMDTELRDSAEEEKIPVGIRPLTRKRYKVDKELQEIPPVSSATEIAIAEADKEKLSSLGNKLRGKAKENAIAEADEEKLSSLGNKLKGKAKENVIAEADEEKLSSLRNKLRGKAKGKTKESFEVEESNGFPLPSATDIAYTLDLSPSGIFSNKRLTSRRGMGSRLKNKSDTNLQTSADVSKTGPSTAGMSQTSVIGSKYKNKSDLEQQRSSNLSEINSSTTASKTILIGSGKAKSGKKVDFTLSTKKRGRPATTSIKTEATVVENFSIPHSPPKSAQVQDNLSATKGTKSGLKAQSKLKTNQIQEKSALPGSEKNYTLRGTRPTTRSSKQK